ANSAEKKRGPKPAISGDLELATCGDFYMATDNNFAYELRRYAEYSAWLTPASKDSRIQLGRRR
ncbi:hypothetical protein, partial [Nonomuraea sp. NPDC049158]|uniref:hypothetical protein n=1 Tax=Nonomuraea sp. NPDC049158 TaxID=3155649 RepID=UPI0033C5A4E4